MLDPGFQGVCERAAARWDVPALAVGVSVGGERASFALGCPEDARFRIASITKTVTATVALRLLDVDTACGVWPGVTVRHLLSHTSGYDCEHGDVARFGNGDDALARLVAELPAVRRWVEPGVVWSYSNAGYWIAGWLCGEARGGGYERAVAEHVLEPWELRETSFDAEPTLAGTGYDAETVDGVYPRARRPSGGLVSSVSDLVRYGEAQLADPATAALRAPAGKPVGGVYGLGFFGERVGGEDVWGHGGSYGGFQSSLLLVPSRGAVFVGLTNGSNGAQALRDAEDEWFVRLLGARRREAPTVELARDELEAVAGVYAQPGYEATVTVDGGGASVGLAVALVDLRPTGERGRTVESRARPIGPRTFAFTDGELVRNRFDFPLPGFARFAGRLAERVG